MGDASIFKNVRIEWSEEKNVELIHTRGISFQDVLLALENEENVLDIYPHPNAVDYPHQTFLIVRIRDYVCAVPFVKEAEKLFLKTIYKSRKLNSYYSPKK
jgi:hypothetical protein